MGQRGKTSLLLNNMMKLFLFQGIRLGFTNEIANTLFLPKEDNIWARYFKG
jgi:hypothetical protein